MLFSYSVIYRAIASEPLFGQFLTACCSEIDPSPYRCVRCLLEDLCTTMVDTIERSTPKSKADRSNIIETRYRGCRGRPEGTREEDFGLMKKGLGKLYDRFTPEERFRLDLEAMSRGDEEESRRLVDSCPRKSYTMSDLAFTDRWLVSEVITLTVCIDLAQHLSRLRILIAFREALPQTYNACEQQTILAYLDGYEAGTRRASWEEAGMEGDPPRWRNGDQEEEDPALEKALDAIRDRIQGMSARFMSLLEADLERHFVEEAKTIWEAFGLFCREELEVEPEKLAAVWMGPALDEIKEHEERLESAETDAERVEEYRQVLLGAWKKFVRSS